MSRQFDKLNATGLTRYGHSTKGCDAPPQKIMTMLFPPGALPKGPPVDAQKALLLIDFQNDFVNKDGKLPVPNVSNFMSNIPSLANKFRSQGSVIWVRTEYAQSRLATSPETGFASILLKQNLETGSDKGSHRVSHLIPVSLLID